MRYIFGPIPSRRFGLSLGIDLSPDSKSCNFDCLYCELPKAKRVERVDNPPKVSEIISELREALELHKNVDVITVTANGEPTLYRELNTLIDEVNLLKRGAKSLILSNSSLLYRLEVQNALLKFDIVKLSLDCVTKSCFKKLDRPISDNIKLIIDSILTFREKFKNTLIIETLFVRGINDNLEEIRELNRVLNLIKPDRVDLNTVDRPPAYGVKALSYQELLEIKMHFFNLNISIANRNLKEIEPQNYNKEEILKTLSKRPLSRFDIENLFDFDSKESLEELLKSENIAIESIAGVDFFVNR